MLYDIVLKNRSYRRFDEAFSISRETLLSLCELARNCASGANRQTLRFHLTHEEEKVAALFPSLRWAGYLANGAGVPKEGERPSAYITILHDTALGAVNQKDIGIAAQTMLLGAVEAGLGGCMFGSFDEKALRKTIGADERYSIELVIALGKPIEKVELYEEPLDIKYWRDKEGVHHVPKRPLRDIIL